MTSMALAATKENRIDVLSRARSLPAGFHDDRRSVYWENGILAKDYTKTTSFVLSPRQDQLYYTKKLHPHYTFSRPSPIWPIPRDTLSAPCSNRLRTLSVPKQANSAYRPSRQVRPPISLHALKAQPSSRISQLAEPKTRPPLEIKPASEWEWSEWASDLKPSALNAMPSTRVSELATPKYPPTGYRPPKRVKWVIPKATLLHTANERLGKLALPKQLTSYQEDYNPNRYRVSRAALLAQPSPCIENLSKPIPRKCRQKKNA